MTIDTSKSREQALEPQTGRSPSEQDLLEEMFQTLRKLEADKTSRGELKILNRALKELRYAFKIFAPYRSVRKVSIFGSARVQPGTPPYEMAVELGRRLAEEGFMSITGAGGGIMEAGHVGAGKEKSFGVNIRLPFEQQPNPFIQGDRKLMTFHFFFTRKLIFVKEADAFAFFPGGFGTQDEALEVLTLAQTGKSGIVPIVLMDLPEMGYWQDWKKFFLERLLREGYISESDLSFFKIVDNVDAAVREFQTFYHNFHSYRFVSQDLVIRVVEQPSSRLIQRINRDFSDILMGEVRETESLPEESNDPETLHFFRLLVPFNRRDFGRLRQMIDLINTEN